MIDGAVEVNRGLRGIFLGSVLCMHYCTGNVLVFMPEICVLDAHVDEIVLVVPVS